MADRPHDPLANVERVRREMHELFGDVLERTGLAARWGFSPRVDVYHCGDPPRAVVKAELAGVDADSVSVEIAGRRLVLGGERRGREPEGRRYQQIEIEHGPFRRVVDLGAEVVAERARASYEDGILRIDVPLAAPALRHVPIEGSGEPVAGDVAERAEGAGPEPERAA